MPPPQHQAHSYALPGPPPTFQQPPQQHLQQAASPPPTAGGALSNPEFRSYSASSSIDSLQMSVSQHGRKVSGMVTMMCSWHEPQGEGTNPTIKRPAVQGATMVCRILKLSPRLRRGPLQQQPLVLLQPSPTLQLPIAKQIYLPTSRSSPGPCSCVCLCHIMSAQYCLSMVQHDSEFRLSMGCDACRMRLQSRRFPRSQSMGWHGRLPAKNGDRSPSQVFDTSMQLFRE